MESEGLDEISRSFLNEKHPKATVEDLEAKSNKKDPTSLYYLGLLLFFGKDIEQNQQQGLTLIETAAEFGNLRAKFFLAIQYLSGKNVKLDFKKGLNLLEEAAEGEIGVAQAKLADVLYEGKICVQNSRRAARFYKLAAKDGDHRSEFLYAKISEKELDSQDFAELFSYYNKAAIAGNPEAMVGAGKIARTGKGKARKNPELAYKYFTKAAQAGLPEAMLQLGLMKYHGEYVQQDRAEGLDNIRRAMELGFTEAYLEFSRLLIDSSDPKELTEAAEALHKLAEQGNPEAQYSYGKMMIKGKGTKKSVSGGMTYIKTASKSEYPPALHSMGVAYREGKNGVHKSLKKSLQAFKRAAELGYGPSMYQYGYMQQEGIGTKENLKEAIKYYKMGAEKGEGHAQFNLALLYEKGQGLKKNYQEAFRLYELASNAGIGEAKYNLGLLLFRGKHCTKDEEKGKQMVIEAASDGVVNAQLWAFELLFESDQEKAFKYLQSAADGGNGKACYILGTYYMDGKFVEKNEEKAANYLLKATSLVYC